MRTNWRHKKAFKELLETANVVSDWSWDQAMRVIINDRRYGALRTLRERKQPFNEFLGQKKKQEVEERRAKQKKAREDYKKMLEESKELTASTRWSKAIAIIEDDERFKAVERAKDREDLFEDYIVELEKKERAKTLEEHKQNTLNSLNLVTLSRQAASGGKCKTVWRLTIEYLRDSEKEEEEQRKLRMYLEDKARVKDAGKLRKITLSSTWTIEDFKAAILEDISSPVVSSMNLKLVFDELHERVKEREEKEAKRRKCLADDFYDFLCSLKEITASSRWEDCNPVFEDWFNREESFLRDTFEKYITELEEKAREKEQKRREENTKKDKEGKDREKRKSEQRRHNERGKEKEIAKKDGTDSENGDRKECYSLEENRRSGRDKESKHKRWHPSSVDDMRFDEKEKDHSKSSRGHSSNSQKSKQMEQHSEAEYDSRHKRHKTDDRNGSHRNSDYEE